MFAPGLISIVFYRRKPTRLQIALGIVFTIALSGLLGYIQDAGTSRVWLNVALAIVLGLALYGAILGYLVYSYFPAKTRATGPAAAPSVDRP